MELSKYRFRSVWRVGASAPDAFSVLSCVEDYVDWWPEVREVRRLSDESFELRCRSVLPYDLVFVSTQARVDPTARVLRATLTGDLNGYSRWTIYPETEGSLLIFDEEVTLGKESLRRIAPIARPAFRANHKIMMSSGERGLRTYLAGYERGQKTPPEGKG